MIHTQVFYDFTLNKSDNMGDILQDIRIEVKNDFQHFTPVIHQVICNEGNYFTAIINVMDYGQEAN